jgi:hypothetical protein
MYTSCLLFCVSISEAEDETSDVTAVAAGSGGVLLPFSFLAAGPGTFGYDLLSWIFKTNFIGRDIGNFSDMFL